MKKAILLTTAVFLASLANAAVITWTTSAITDSNDVSNIGTTVEAINGVGTTQPSPTVNGVTFTADATLLAKDTGGDGWSTEMTDSSYDSLLSTIDWNNNGTTSALDLYTFSDLTVGQEYLFQYWYADDAAAGVSRTLTLSLGSDTQSGDYVLDGTTYATATFIADEDSIDLYVTSTQSGARVTALQLRAIPEPATFGLVGLSGCLLLFARRRFTT